MLSCAAVQGVSAKSPSVVRVALMPCRVLASGGNSDVGTIENTFEIPEYSGTMSGSTYFVRTAEWIPSQPIKRSPVSDVPSAKVAVTFPSCSLILTNFLSKWMGMEAFCAAFIRTSSSSTRRIRMYPKPVFPLLHPVMSMVPMT